MRGMRVPASRPEKRAYARIATAHAAARAAGRYRGLLETSSSSSSTLSRE